MALPKESRGKVLHRIFYENNKNPAIRKAMSDYKHKRLSPNQIESILSHHGYSEAEESSWEKTGEPQGDWTGNGRRNKKKKDGSQR